jgi:hypothetical protein
MAVRVQAGEPDRDGGATRRDGEVAAADTGFAGQAHAGKLLHACRDGALVDGGAKDEVGGVRQGALRFQEMSEGKVAVAGVGFPPGKRATDVNVFVPCAARRKIRSVARYLRGGRRQVLRKCGGHGAQRRKFPIRRRPAAWDFSGWNWVPRMLSRPTMAVISPP